MEVPTVPSWLRRAAKQHSEWTVYDKSVDITYNDITGEFKERRTNRTPVSKPFDEGERSVERYENGKRKILGRW